MKVDDLAEGPGSKSHVVVVFGVAACRLPPTTAGVGVDYDSCGSEEDRAGYHRTVIQGGPGVSHGM